MRNFWCLALNVRIYRRVEGFGVLVFAQVRVVLGFVAPPLAVDDDVTGCGREVGESEVATVVPLFRSR